MTRIKGFLPKQFSSTPYIVLGAISVIALAALATVGIGYKLFFKSSDDTSPNNDPKKEAFLAKVPENVRDDVSNVIDDHFENAFKLPPRSETIDPNYYNALQNRQNRLKNAIYTKFQSEEGIENELFALDRSAKLSEELFNLSQKIRCVKDCFSKEGLLSMNTVYPETGYCKGNRPTPYKDSVKPNAAEFNLLRLRCLNSIKQYFNENISLDQLSQLFIMHRTQFEKDVFLAKVPDDVQKEVAKIIDGEINEAFSLPKFDNVESYYHNVLSKETMSIERRILSQYQNLCMQKPIENIDEAFVRLKKLMGASQQLYDMAQKHSGVKHCFSINGVLSSEAVVEIDKDLLPIQNTCGKLACSFVNDQETADGLNEHFKQLAEFYTNEKLRAESHPIDSEHQETNILDIVRKLLPRETIDTFINLIVELANDRTTVYQLNLPDSLDLEYREALQKAYSGFEADIKNSYGVSQQANTHYTSEDQTPQDLCQAFLKLQRLKTLGRVLFNTTQSIQSISDVKCCFSKDGLISKENAVYPDKTYVENFKDLWDNCQYTTLRLLSEKINLNEATEQLRKHQNEFNTYKIMHRKVDEEYQRNLLTSEKKTAQALAKIAQDLHEESEQVRREREARLKAEMQARLENEKQATQCTKDFLDIIESEGLEHMKVFKDPVDIERQLCQSLKIAEFTIDKITKLTLCSDMLGVWADFKKGNISKEVVKEKLVALHADYIAKIDQ